MEGRTKKLSTQKNNIVNADTKNTSNKNIVNADTEYGVSPKTVLESVRYRERDTTYSGP
jgi:hypothetical protein